MFMCRKSWIAIIIAVLAFTLSLSCAIGSGPVGQKTVTEPGWGVLSVQIPGFRGWSVQQYTVTATRAGETPVVATSTSNSVSMRLKIGAWAINVEGRDEVGNIIYQGVASATVTETGTSVVVGLLQKAGNIKLNISQLPAYGVSSAGQPGSIEKITVTASMSGFPDVVKEVSDFSTAVLFSHLAQGSWSFKVEAKAPALNPDYSQMPGQYTTYTSGTFAKNVLASKLTTEALALNKQDKVTPVLFDRASGNFSTTFNLTLTCATTEASIYYSTNGAAPTTLYSGPVSIPAATTTVKAVAKAGGMADSIIGSNTYTYNALVTASPQLSPAGGSYTQNTNVTVSCPEAGATIYYTTDGTDPSDTSATFNGSGIVAVNGNGVIVRIKAMAKAVGKDYSPVAVQDYSITYPSASAPVITPTSGTYSTNQVFSMSCGTPGAVIYYTTNGTAPTAASYQYTAPFNLAAGSYTIKAIAVATNYSNSLVTAENYTIIADANNSISFVQADLLYIGNDPQLNVVNLPAGVKWFGMDVDPASSYILEWTLGYDGIITVYENDMTTVVPLSGDVAVPNMKGATLGVKRYFVKVNSTFAVDAFNIKIYEGSISVSPSLSVSASTLAYGDVVKGQSSQQTFVVSNNGGSTLDWSLTKDQTWLSLTPTSGTGITGATTSTVTATIDTTAMNPGTYTANITVTSATAGVQGSPKTIGVTINVTSPATTTTTITTTTTVGTGLVVHFKLPAGWANAGSPKIHYWNTAPAVGQSTWPGNSMTSEGNSWYVYTITGATSASIVFNNNSAPQSADLTRTGEGWYSGTTWYSANPDGPTPPAVSANPPGTTFTTAALSVTLSVTGGGITGSKYTTDGSDPSIGGVSFTNGQVIDIGTPMSVGQTKTLKLWATNGAVSDNKSYTFTKQAAGSGLTVHLKKPASWTTAYIHYWNVVPVIANTTWPGNVMNAEANGWYAFTIPGATSASIIFNNNGSPQTGNLTRATTEGWYFTDNLWYDTNPEAPKVPVITSTPVQKTYSTAQNVTLVSNNASGDTIYYTTDGTVPTAASPVYTTAINIGPNGGLAKTWTIKAYGHNTTTADGAVATFSYTIDPNFDEVPPVITASPNPGSYATAQNVVFTITDNKPGPYTVYYTTDGTDPETSVTKVAYTSGTPINVSSTTAFQVYAKDTTNNEITGSYYYHIGSYQATRFDPRQESIYFLLTARWFDGDAANTIGDEWCSYTPERWAKDPTTHGGFTGPEDVTWRGDFKGLVEKLDYIKALGFTAVWITPVVQNRSPMSYHGYHGWDFTKEDSRLVSPGYGFQRVIDEAHARDMKICLDIVLNHSGRFGIKNFSEIKFNTDPLLYPNPDTWTPGWFYDGLTSPGIKGGLPMHPSTRVGDVRPFDANDLTHYPYLATDRGANTFLKYQWPCTESYCKTMDGVWDNGGAPGSLTLDGYKTSARKHRGHNTGFPTGSGSFDNFPDAHFDSCHEDCPDLNTESPAVQNYLLSAYNRYIDMGVDMFRVDTVMHINKTTLNDSYWPQLLARADQSKSSRGGADFFIFGEVANFVCNPTDKASQLREQNYTYDNSLNDTSTQNCYLNGNNYRTPDYSHKAPNAAAKGHVSVINMIAHNSFCNGEGSGYGAALNNDSLYNDATFMPWYADSHDYGPNKSTTRYSGDFKPLWSMLFTFRGIPVVYYGSEIRFKQGMPNDWPGGGANGVDMSLEKTGRGYFGDQLAGSVTATDFGEYSASGQVNTTLNSAESQHLMRLNKIRLAVPALQMGQYSTTGCSGGWAAFKRRYTGTSSITGQAIDSYALVVVGGGSYNFSGVLDGEYKEIVTNTTHNASGGNLSGSFGGGGANLRVFVKTGLTTPAPAGSVIGSASADIF